MDMMGEEILLSSHKALPQSENSHQFSYDGHSQLTKEEGPFPHTYQYAAFGNFRKIDEDTVTVNGLNQRGKSTFTFL
jgi:hypothetical protein